MKLLTCLLLLPSQLCFGQAFTFNQGGPTSKDYYEEIPYEKESGLLFVTCDIAGKKHRFLFDTGAPVAISNELAAELKAKHLAKVLMSDLFLHSDSSSVFELNGIKLGNLTFDHIPAINIFPDFYKCLNIDGVIGSNMLRNSIVSFNSQKKLIIITDKKSKLHLKAKNGGNLMFKHSNQSDPQIQLFINRRVHLILPFDTGDSDFMRISNYTINLLKPYGVVDSLTTGYGSGGFGVFGAQKNAVQKLNKIDPFTIGNGKFTNLMVMSQQENMPAIGNKLLDYGTLTLDFINSKFYFDAYNESVDLARKVWPVAYGYLNGKISVAVVWESGKTLAEPGEQVLAIDDKDCSNFTICEYINEHNLLDGKETAVLTIKNKQGDIRKVTIVKQ